MQVLASEVNIGYEEIVNTQVHKVNGKPVKNLSDLTKQIEGCKDQYLRFDLEYNQVAFPVLGFSPAYSPALSTRVSLGCASLVFLSAVHHPLNLALVEPEFLLCSVASSTRIVSSAQIVADIRPFFGIPKPYGIQ